MNKTIYKQKGTAAIYLVFLLIPLFGAVFLALEGTRYIQKQNRLADASEAAALAITMANRGKITDYEEVLSTKYVQSYVRQIKDIPVLSVSVTKGEDIVGKVRKPYVQYKVDAKTAHKSWFSSLLIPSFSPVESVVNQAIARNYPEIAGDKYVDIVFVSDFSGSMNRIWNGTWIWNSESMNWTQDKRTKIEVLKDAVLKISTEILAGSDNEGTNKIGFVPFNYYVQRKIGNKKKCVDQLQYVGSKINFVKTVDNIFEDKYDTNPKSHWDCYFRFHTIAMTNDINKLRELNSMSAKSSTAVYQGIIKGAELLYKERSKYPTVLERVAYKKRLKMLFILSDGTDSSKNVFPSLVNEGLCQKIKGGFSDGDVPLYMAVLGINFDASKQDVFKQCVGQDNIVDVKNVDDLIIKIKEMIKKGAQTEGVTKLHYRNLN